MDISLLDKLSQLRGKYHKSTIKNVAFLLSILLQSRTVNLNHLKDDAVGCVESSHTQPQSHYKRLTRFFARYSRSRLFIDLLRGVLQYSSQKIAYASVDATAHEVAMNGK